MILSSLLGLLGGAANFGMGVANSAIQYKFNKRLQDDAQSHQKEMFQNQHQWEVNDLRAAGLNPILSAHSGSSMPSASSSSVSLPSTSFDLVDSLNDSESFLSKHESRQYNREMHDVKLAQEEAALANSELDAEYKRAMIHDVGVNTALKMLDLDYLGSPFAKSMRYYKSVMDVSKNDSKIGQYFDSVQNTILRPFMLNSALDSLEGHNPVKVLKKPTKSNYTKYQYKTR